MAPSLPVSAHLCFLKTIKIGLTLPFDHINHELTSRVMPCSGNKQLFEFANGAELFFTGIACFMLLREIEESAFFRRAEKQGSNENSRGNSESF